MKSFRALALLGLLLGVLGQASTPEGKSPPAPGIAAPAADPRIRELESAIWRELAIVESRIGSIKRRLQELRIVPEGREPGGPSQEAPFNLMGPTEDEQKKYDSLLERQGKLVRKWRELSPGKAVQDKGDEASKQREREKNQVRMDLRSVLVEVLELREKVRSNQLERLRRQLDELEKAVRARQDERLRRTMVESRLGELLDAGGAVESNPPP